MTQHKSHRSVATQSAQLAVAVPQVVAHRLTRMAMAGTPVSARDQREFTRMVAEKQQAFGQAAQAMAIQTMVAQQALATTMMKSMWGAWLGKAPASPVSVVAQMQNAALGVLEKGLAPVHHKAVANAKRLGKTPLR